MSNARSLLARLRKLETSGTNPVMRKLGSIEAFAATVNALIALGKIAGDDIDKSNPLASTDRDGPFIIKAWVRMAEQVEV